MKKKVNMPRLFLLNHGDIFTITAKQYYNSNIIQHNLHCYHILSIEEKRKYLHIFKIRIPLPSVETYITLRYDGFMTGAD